MLNLINAFGVEIMLIYNYIIDYIADYVHLHYVQF